jgi:alpha-L-arabinofuranosidase
LINKTAKMKRRDFIKTTGIGGASVVLTSGINIPFVQQRAATLTINPSPRFELSQWLYMQFMEPLGVTDSSVEAAWDHQTDKWRDDVIQVTKDLSPGMIRWGGIFSSYYRWKEAVGPRDKRKPMLNITWNGIESNQIGTAEFVDFCRQTGADPLMAVNFESEGNPGYARTKKGDIRSADAKEAAEWVDYCNNPLNKLRIQHGFTDPLTIKIWQLGNETSYGRDKFDIETAAKKTVEFAKAMRASDPSVKLIGWGDSGWAKKMIDIAGENIDFIAFHHMFNPAQNLKNAPLHDNEYRKDPAGTWDILMNAYKIHETKINGIRSEISSYKMPLALTECHYAIPGRNRCEVLSSWAAGVSYARMMNLHERNGDLLKIATLADFCGTRWQVNAVMIPVPSGKAFLMPVAKIMSLYRKHTGKQYVDVTGVPDELDITASRTGNTIYLHVVNTSRVKSNGLIFNVGNLKIKSAIAFELSGDPELEILSAANDPLVPKERILPVNETVTFPAASVTAVELTVE